MSERMSRRAFHAALIAGALSAETIAQAQSFAPGTGQTPTPQPPPATLDETRDYPAPTFKPKLRKPRLSGTLVQDFVIFAHYDLDMVKKLLEKEPAVLNATVDWGGGDWEAAIGGASHMGRRDIALFLLDKGARPDLFTATMLGHLDVVKSLLTAHPLLIDSKGPHGIPLLAHAKMGGKEAENVFNYLESLKRNA